MGAEVIKLCADCAHVTTKVCASCFNKDCWSPANVSTQAIKLCADCVYVTTKVCDCCRDKEHWVPAKVITKTEDLTDVANQPHYTCFKIQPIEFIKANELGFLEGNVIKYICRYPYKGTPLKDLYKAKDYIEHLIQKEKEKCHE
jgi:hypothetical protein